MSIKASVLLKVATVLGDEFDSTSLHAILPMRTESLSSVNKMIKLLEANNFVEVFNKQQDVLYARFNRPFLRETLYQVMLYKDQKNTMHGAAARHLMRTRHVSSLLHSESAEQACRIQSKQICQHLMISQDIHTTEQLSIENRKELTVYQIQTLFQINPKAVVKRGELWKAGGKSEKQKPA